MMTTKKTAWFAWMAACSFAALFALHCGDDDATTPGPSTIDSGTSTTPDTSTPPTQDSSVPQPDTGAPTADSGGDAAPPTLPPCAVGNAHSFSALLPDGGVLYEGWELASVGGVPGNPWRISNALKGHGDEYFLGAGAGSAPNFFDGGTTLFPFKIGWARASETQSATPRSVYCFGSGTATRVNDTVDLRTTTGKSLGQCPGGTAVAGEVTICGPGSFMCTTPVQGSLTGVTIDVTGFTISGDAADPPKFGVNGLGPQLVLSATSDTTPTGGQTTPIHGIFVTNPTDTAPASIYCLGTGSELQWVTVNGTYVTFKNVTKLGECGAAAPGTESFRLCRY